jgi:hypothetical protein
MEQSLVKQYRVVKSCTSLFYSKSLKKVLNHELKKGRVLAKPSFSEYQEKSGAIYGVSWLSMGHVFSSN